MTAKTRTMVIITKNNEKHSKQVEIDYKLK